MAVGKLKSSWYPQAYLKLGKGVPKEDGRSVDGPRKAEILSKQDGTHKGPVL